MTIIVVDNAKLDNDKILRLINGDITERNVDVIVNAANSYLRTFKGYLLGYSISTNYKVFLIDEVNISC